MIHLATTRRKRGFTLLEIVIATAILSVLLAGITQFFIASSRAFSSATVKAYVESRAQSIVDRIVEECVAGHFLSLNPPVPTLSDFIRFDKIVGMVLTDPVYGNPIHIGWRAVSAMNDGWSIQR